MQSEYTPAEIASFWNRVDQSTASDTCWPWRGARTAAGYGEFGLHGKILYAHRFSWMLTHGPIPKGMSICHHCDQPSCCRPDHLFLATHAENMADMLQKGRNSPPPHYLGEAHWTHIHPGHVAQGEANGFAKITEKTVREIRSEYIPFEMGVARLARKYGLSKTHVHDIVTRRRWSHIR